MEGTLFGRYRLVALLGRGGMGEVWRAEDTAANNRTVAIKMLPPQLAQDDTFVARFRREADAAARLNNPHIIPIHNYGEIDGRLYVDMRLVEGRDLQQVLTEGPLQPARAVRIIEGIAMALQAAHKVGLLHRDVKPSNILLDENDFAYLIDFGIALSAEDTRLTQTGSVIGTVHYLAPECLGPGEVDARADIYALACVLYECLTGRPPFSGPTMASLMYAHLHTPVPRPSAKRPGVSQRFDRIIATGMAKDPHDRYATAAELVSAVQEAVTTPIPVPEQRKLTPPPVVVNPAPPTAPQRPPLPPPQFAPPPPPPRQGQRGGLSAPMVVALIAAVVAIVVIVVAVTGYLQRQPDSPAPETRAAPLSSSIDSTTQSAPSSIETSQTSPPAADFATVEQRACIGLGAAHDAEGHRCAIATWRVSAVSPEWVFVQGLGYYTGTDEPPTFAELTGQATNMIINMTTQQAIGPTGVGWCPPDTGNAPIPGYIAVPVPVLAEFGLSPCS